MLSFFPRGVLDEVLNLIESVYEDFPSYSLYITLKTQSSKLEQSSSNCGNILPGTCISNDGSYYVCRI